jgi:uncharacterized membrane protein
MESGTTEEFRARGRRSQRSNGKSRAGLASRRSHEAQNHLQPNGAERRARGLGWFSVGLGLAQLVAPRRLSVFTLGGDGRRRERTMRLLGARELACGLGILAQPRKSGWVWMRVAGDLMDLALLGSSLTARRTDQARVMRSLASVVGVTALDALTSIQLSRQSRGHAKAARCFTSSITVNRRPDEVYQFWRNLQNLPSFMAHLESVEVRDDRRSRWIAKGPGRTRVQWEAEITEDRPNERLCWCSVEGSQIDNAGTVTFRQAPGGRGTEIVLELEYVPPGGLFGVKLARLLGEEPSQKAASDLRRFKQVMETGEVLNSDASIHRGPHPARPPEGKEFRLDGGRR